MLFRRTIRICFLLFFVAPAILWALMLLVGATRYPGASAVAFFIHFLLTLYQLPVYHIFGQRGFEVYNIFGGFSPKGIMGIFAIISFYTVLSVIIAWIVHTLFGYAFKNKQAS